MRNPRQLQQIRDLVAPVCEARGVSLVDARFSHEGGAVLKVLIETPGSDPAKGSGVTLDICQQISRDLSGVLDAHEELTPKGAYRLEVGSPGLERPLFGLPDYERFAGREVRLHASRPIEGRRRFSGLLRGVEKENVLLEQDGSEVRIPHQDVVKANLVYRF